MTADLPSLRALATQVFLDTYAGDGIRPSLAREAEQQFSIAALQAELDRADRRIVLVEQAGHLIAFAQLSSGGRTRARRRRAGNGARAPLRAAAVPAARRRPTAAVPTPRRWRAPEARPRSGSPPGWETPGPWPSTAARAIASSAARSTPSRPSSTRTGCSRSRWSSQPSPETRHERTHLYSQAMSVEPARVSLREVTAETVIAITRLAVDKSQEGLRRAERDLVLAGAVRARGLVPGDLPGRHAGRLRHARGPVAARAAAGGSADQPLALHDRRPPPGPGHRPGRPRPCHRGGAKPPALRQAGDLRTCPDPAAPSPSTSGSAFATPAGSTAGRWCSSCRWTRRSHGRLRGDPFASLRQPWRPALHGMTGHAHARGRRAGAGAAHRRPCRRDVRPAVGPGALSLHRRGAAARRRAPARPLRPAGDARVGGRPAALAELGGAPAGRAAARLCAGDGAGQRQRLGRLPARQRAPRPRPRDARDRGDARAPRIGATVRPACWQTSRPRTCPRSGCCSAWAFAPRRPTEAARHEPTRERADLRARSARERRRRPPRRRRRRDRTATRPGSRRASSRASPRPAARDDARSPPARPQRRRCPRRTRARPSRSSMPTSISTTRPCSWS